MILIYVVVEHTHVPLCPTEPPQNKQNKDLKQVLQYFLVAANFVGNIFLTIFLSENTRLSVLFMINIIYIRYHGESLQIKC